ncbi:MFS transporter, FSR family, fosmidomycin resistance protein [Prevotella sp. KH2C16]|nr:MFS transporter, FSR family, fosmidomycin resistance protein [Prevotella sp. KH2C16]
MRQAGSTSFAVLFTVSFCHFLNDTIQSMLPSIYPMLKSDFALSFAQIGAITLVLQLTSSIMQPLVGLYADKHHHAWQLSVGMVFTLAGIFLLSSATSFPMILMAVALFGCGSSVFHPQASQVAQLASGGRKGLAQSIFQVGGNAGYAVGPLLAAVIILPHGMPGIRYFAVVAILAATILGYVGRWHMRELKTYAHKARSRWATVKPYSRGQIYFFVFILFMLMFSKNFYTASMTNYFTFFLIDKFAVSIQQSQLCLFVFLAAQAVGTIVGGWLGDRYGRKYVIWFSIFGAAPFTLLLPYVGTLWGTILLSVAIGLIIASAFSAILVYATDLMPAHTGVVAGIFYGLSFGLGGLGSSFFGWLADQTSILFIFKVSTLLPLLGVIAVYLPKMKKETI